jgi:REP element-mobilizing transposase RayT
MARQLRIEYPGALYHITDRGNERKAVFPRFIGTGVMMLIGAN